MSKVQYAVSTAYVHLNVHINFYVLPIFYLHLDLTMS